jgi:DNA-binding transcriptional LysR family regulator
LIRLAFLHTFGTWLVPDLIGSYRRAHPQAPFRLGQGVGPVITEALLDGQYDLILTSPRPEHPLISWRPLLTQPLRLAVPPDHHLAGRKRVRLEEVATDQFVTMQRDYWLRTTTDRLCAEAGFAPRIAFEGEGPESLLALVAAGLGVAIVPEPHGDSRSLPPHMAIIAKDASRVVGLAWHAERELTPSTELFHEFVIASYPRGRRTTD